MAFAVVLGGGARAGLGAQAEHAGGHAGHGGRALRRLGAGVLAGAAAHHAVRGPASSGCRPRAAWGSKGLILPAVSLALLSAATLARLVRSSLLEVLSQDYLTTARAKGLSRTVVILRHALPNAADPGDHGDGPPVRRALLSGRRHHRDDLRPARARQAGRGLDPEQGPPDRPGGDPGAGHDLRRDEPAGRPLLRLDRPTGSASSERPMGRGRAPRRRRPRPRAVGRRAAAPPAEHGATVAGRSGRAVVADADGPRPALAPRTTRTRSTPVAR